MRHYRWRGKGLCGLLTAALIALAACGGGSGGGGRAETASQAVDLAAGQPHSVAFADGAIVELPATALDSAQRIEFERREEGVYPSYRIAPLSLQLLSPARLRLPLAGADEARRWVIARNDDGQWRPLISSLQQAGEVTASITELGEYRLQLQPQLEVSGSIGPDCDTAATQQSLRFIHVADLHARYGGPEQLFSRIKHYHRQALAETPYTVFSNGGDDFEKGSLAELLSEGQSTVAVTQAMAFDVRVVGNHDYAWGAQTLLDFAADPHAQVLASNSEYRASGAENFQARGIVALQVGCLKVGFFGMTSVPWNELDRPLQTPPIPDFFPEVRMNWDWQQTAAGVVSQYRDQVDVLVMVSHLGAGADRQLLNDNPQIDIALGGHSHGGVLFEQLPAGNLLIQPDFYAEGLSDVQLRYALSDKRLLEVGVDNIVVRDIAEIDAELSQHVDAIVRQYAPDAYAEIALSEQQPSERNVAEIAARAALFNHGADAALLDPAQVGARWLPGSVTANSFHRAFLVERQPANTPGFNALYRVTVSAGELAAMRAAQPDWVYASAGEHGDEDISVVLFKGSALNLAEFFPNLSARPAQFLSESWASLDAYARQRSADCLFLDSDQSLLSCEPDTLTSTWQFHADDEPLRADSGPSQLHYYRGSGSGVPETKTRFLPASLLPIPALPDGDSVVMAFDGYHPDEGLRLLTGVAGNGDFAELGKLSDYSVVMDVLWPAASDGLWRALLQTAADNSDDADIFLEAQPAGGVGIATERSGYFGRVESQRWYRLGLVFYAGGEGGTFKAYLDGELIGSKDGGDVGERWAVLDEMLLFTDDSYETSEGFVNALLFSGRALSDSELQTLGPASRELRFAPSAAQLQQRVQRHQQVAPY